MAACLTNGKKDKGKKFVFESKADHWSDQLKSYKSETIEEATNITKPIQQAVS